MTIAQSQALLAVTSPACKQMSKRLDAFRQSQAGFVPKAGGDMIVDETGGLHVCIHDRTANKFETALLQVLGQSVGFGGRGGNIAVFPETILDGFAVDKPPDVFAEGFELILYGEKRLCVSHRGGDFQSIANDAGIGQ